MLRGLPHLCKFMPEPRDARRLLPDPEHEPDFYALAKRFPLPEDPLVSPQDGTADMAVSAAQSALRERLASEVFGLAGFPQAKRPALGVAPAIMPPSGPSSTDLLLAHTALNQAAHCQQALAALRMQASKAMTPRDAVIAALSQQLGPARGSPHEQSTRGESGGISLADWLSLQQQR